MKKIKQDVIENSVKKIVTDELIEFLRQSAQSMLQTALEIEVQEFMKYYQNAVLENGYQRIVRNSYLPERTVQSGIGGIEFKMPRIRDRAGEITFMSHFTSKYMMRTVTLGY